MSTNNNTEIILAKIAEITSGLPIHRYTEDNLAKQKVLQQKSMTKENKDIDYTVEELSTDIDQHYYTRKNDIIYKLQGQNFARRITSEENIIVTHNFAIIRLKEGYDAEFITSLLNNPIVENQILIKSMGSRVPKVNIKTLKNLKIRVPDIDRQKEFSKIFKLIDKRIELKKEAIQYDEELKESLINNIVGDLYEYQ